LFTTIKICQELERTDRFIVTNCPLILNIFHDPLGAAVRTQRLCDLLSTHLARNDKEARKLEEQLQMYWTIQEYCQTFIKRPIDVSRRLICINEEQSREFWRYLPQGELNEPPEGIKVFHNDHPDRPSRGFILPNVADEMYETVPDFTFRKGLPGVYYVLDEVHQLFSSRQWQKNAPQAERYMSQLRKLNDDLDLVTQDPEKVDKNFRRNATDWVQVDNMSKSPLFMGVTFKGRFRALHYHQVQKPQRFDKPDSTEWYQLGTERRYEWLYKTAEGVGVSGGIISEDSRFKGRHWSVWVIAVLLIGVLAYFFPRMLMSATQHIVSGTAKAFQSGVSRGVAAAVPGNPAYHADMPAAPAPAPQRIIAAYNLPVGAPAPEPVVRRPSSDDGAPAGIYSTGYCMVGTNVWVSLSDGSVCKSENGEVQGFGEKFVRVNGWGKIPVKYVR